MSKLITEMRNFRTMVEAPDDVISNLKSKMNETKTKWFVYTVLGDGKQKVIMRNSQQEAEAAAEEELKKGDPSVNKTCTIYEARVSSIKTNKRGGDVHNDLNDTEGDENV